jgi:hypothetical protein
MLLKINNVYQILFAVISLTLIAYALFNARFLLSGPELIISNLNPKTNTIQSSDKNFVLEGTALHSAYISVNDRPITIDETGDFRETLLLTQKINPVYIVARDRLSKEKHLMITVVYTGDTEEITFDEIISTMMKQSASSTTTTSPTISTTSEEF